MSPDVLSDDEVAELQARPSTELGGYRRVLLRPRERDALCATVRALRAGRDELRKEAREAAFKDAISAINAVPMSRYWSDSGEEIARSFRAQAIHRVEAAANTEEGGGDG